MLLQVNYSYDGESHKYTKYCMSYTKYCMSDEFFKDYADPEACVPKSLLETINPNYLGWQKIDLSTVDKEVYRPKDQKTTACCDRSVDPYSVSEAGYYDKAYGLIIYVRIRNLDDLLKKWNAPRTFMSPKVQEAVLLNQGYKYAGTRFCCHGRTICGIATDEYRDIYVQNGVVFVVKRYENTIPYYEPSMHINIKLNDEEWHEYYILLGDTGGSAEGYGAGTHIHFANTPRGYNNVINDPRLLQYWGKYQGNTFYMWGYDEKLNSEADYDKVSKDEIKIIKNSPELSKMFSFE